MQLRQTETFSALNHHYGGIGDVDADLDHCCGNQQACFASLKTPHGLIFIGSGHLSVHQTDRVIPQNGSQPFKAVFGRGEVGQLTFFDKGANPIDLPALGNRVT